MPRSPARAGACAGRRGREAAIRPSASTTVAPARLRPGPTSAITPSATIRSAAAEPSSRAPRNRRTSLIVRPPSRRRRRVFVAPRTRQQQVERGHAHRDAVRHLLEHRRAGRIRGFGGDLESPVHRSRVHHHAIGTEGGEPSRVEPPPAGILPFSGEIRRSHALQLDPQHHERVRLAGDGLVEVVAARGPATPRRRWGPASAARRA